MPVNETKKWTFALKKWVVRTFCRASTTLSIIVKIFISVFEKGGSLVGATTTKLFVSGRILGVQKFILCNKNH